ncbi:hypothetical protein THRCLA_11318, partial [Thraustotheca clavata]
VTIHQVAQKYRGLSVWSLVNAYPGVWNDLWECQAVGCSLIRGANNYSDQVKLNWEVTDLGIPVGKPLADLIDANFGQFGSIDIYLGEKPTSLEFYYLAYRNFVITSLMNHELSSKYMNITQLSLDIAPLAWRGENMTYYTGNPMCLSSIPKTFVQSQFSFYDACTTQTQSQITLTRASLLFSLISMHITSNESFSSLTTLCSQCFTLREKEMCDVRIKNAMDIIAVSDIQFYDGKQLMNAMKLLNLTMIQFASNASKPTFLTQSVVATNDPWSFFGWSMVYDWLQGDREVFKFESDQGLYLLITDYNEPAQFPANPLELTQYACTYIWMILVYSSILMVCVVLIIILTTIATKDERCGLDLVLFHRVASIVWVGRPFLALRGFSALVLLSTSPLDFMSENGISKFVVKPRSTIEAMVFASEATWITYVIVDLILPLTQHHAATYAPTSAFMAWITMVAIEISSPFVATASINQTCSIVTLGLSATCSGGVVQIGSVSRFIILCLINILSVFTALCYTLVFVKSTNVSMDLKKYDMMPAAAVSFFHWDNGSCFRSPVKQIMAGMLPFKKIVFHINLWQLINPKTLNTLQSKLSIPNMSAQVPWQFGIWEAGGIVYVIMSVIGSYTYIYVSSTVMSNDFWWDSFNSSGHQTFLATLFTNQLQVTGSATNLDLTNFQYADNTNLYNTIDTVLHVPTLYATMIQDEVNTLSNVIQGIRQMDGCKVPWIASYFCYVDFNKSWEMALSTHRQQQCALLDMDNGAVYLESYLRNVNWEEYNYCWLTSLEIGVLSFLRSSIQGQLWIQSITKNLLPVSAEVDYWNQKGITKFITQWQNYKALGVIESFSIRNAFGLSYPITLKYSNCSRHTNMQTSFKMQWPLASQFWAIATNGSLMSGASLVRQSPRYAFANTTMLDVLTENMTVVAPLDIGFVIIQNTIGPFGEVMMRRIAYPAILLTWYKTIQSLTFKSILQANSSSFATLSSIAASTMLNTAPKSCGQNKFLGGDITCPTQTVPSTLAIFYSIQGVCVSQKQDAIMASGLMGTQVLLSVGPKYDIKQACKESVMGTMPNCLSLFLQSKNFVSEQFTQEQWNFTMSLSESTKSYFQQQLPVVITQYMQNGNDTFLLQGKLFDSLDIDYHLYGWLYLLEWLSGVREVVQFSGVNGSIIALSGRNAINSGPINRLEVPVNVAIFFRYVLLYVSTVLLLVALLACIYIAFSRCCIEGFNMLALNRVTGLVWIGRALLFLRGVTAICLLSTSKLALQQSNGFYYLVEQSQSYVASIMAAGEVTWLVYLLNDCFSVITREYTQIYADHSCIAVWLATAIWSLFGPIRHEANIYRTCTAVTIDEEIMCHAGEVAIGSFNRFCGLIGLSGALVLITFCLQRCRHSYVRDITHPIHLLHATALYHYNRERWTFNDIYYIDRASAAFNGLISWPWNEENMAVLDIKTWRMFFRPYKSSSLTKPAHLCTAIPLDD